MIVDDSGGYPPPINDYSPIAYMMRGGFLSVLNILEIFCFLAILYVIKYLHYKYYKLCKARTAVLPESYINGISCSLETSPLQPQGKPPWCIS